MSETITQAVQDYLKAIHRLGGDDRVVSPADIAVVLSVKAPSVTGMLKRLAEAGWIHYTPGTGAKLTDVGVLEARRVIRRHRLNRNEQSQLVISRTLPLHASKSSNDTVTPRMNS